MNNPYFSITTPNATKLPPTHTNSTFGTNWYTKVLIIICNFNSFAEKNAEKLFMAKDYIRINTPLELAYYKGNVVVNYKYNHKTFRYNLLKIEERLFLPKISALKPDDTIYNCVKAVKEIENKLPLIKKALVALTEGLDKSDPKATITKKAVDEHIEKYKGVTKTPTGFVEDFRNWIEIFKEEKRQEEILSGKEPRKNHPTVKDYVSALNLLQDFQHDFYKGSLIQYQDFDNDFITDLISYCWEERDEIAEGDNYKYLTKGDLSNKTINKRFDCIFTFITRYYKNLPEGVLKPKLETLQRKIIRLDRNDLKTLSEIKVKDSRQEKVRDYFMFLCYTGLRFSDFIRLDRTFYQEETNEIVIKATKTSAECRIYLFDKAKEIAEKYNFCFRDYAYNASLNRAIHELLDDFDLFGEDTTMEYMQKGRKTYTKKRRELITTHAGRRTYISIMVECGLGLYELMSTTGHKKIDTLKFYIDRFGESRRAKFIKINETLKQ